MRAAGVPTAVKHTLHYLNPRDNDESVSKESASMPTTAVNNPDGNEDRLIGSL